jgi:hypothetical protein
LLLEISAGYKRPAAVDDKHHPESDGSLSLITKPTGRFVFKVSASMTAHPGVVNIFFAGCFAVTAPGVARSVDRRSLLAYFNKLGFVSPTRAQLQPISALRVGFGRRNVF